MFSAIIVREMLQCFQQAAACLYLFSQKAMSIADNGPTELPLRLYHQENLVKQQVRPVSYRQ